MVPFLRTSNKYKLFIEIRSQEAKVEEEKEGKESFWKPCCEINNLNFLPIHIKRSPSDWKQRKSGFLI